MRNKKFRSLTLLYSFAVKYGENDCALRRFSSLPNLTSRKIFKTSEGFNALRCSLSVEINNFNVFHQSFDCRKANFEPMSTRQLLLPDVNVHGLSESSR